MRVQYIYDAEGRRTGVIVPIDLWYSLGIEKSVEKECGIREPEKYRGIYRSLKVDLKDAGPTMRRFLLDTNILIYYRADAITI